MSQIALLGAVELGLVYALVALGIYLSFRVLDFPDLTVDGSFPLGAAVAATLIVSGHDPWLATALAVIAGAASGVLTAVLAVRFGILHLLASILTMIALYSVTLRVMGRPNVAILTQDTVLTPFYGIGVTDAVARPLAVGIFVVAAALLVAAFLESGVGLAMRATGANPRMARAQGVPTGLMVGAGIAISNGLVALGGALFAQANGFADVTAGVGTIVVGLAAVIVGETVVRTRSILGALIGCVVGSILYRIAVQLALSADAVGLQASDLNLVTAVLVAAALVLPRIRRRRSAGRAAA
ncbi:ABC transporter permease [Arenibaculum pallidiluteum]|uniref:ABC transporter permease n=1 Tax=Arenibaculum pallidiluteum TaxID=2812559 RepID=UPI001A96F0C4|nr:ABC transporter permease [Arenibaculum pallidiluteum]